MFRVVEIEAGKTFSERVLFKSMVEKDVWDFYLKLNSNVEIKENSIKAVYVKSSLDEFINIPKWVFEIRKISA